MMMAKKKEIAKYKNGIIPQQQSIVIISDKTYYVYGITYTYDTNELLENFVTVDILLTKNFFD